MRISVYKIDLVKPITEDQYDDICEMLGCEHLKTGSAEFIGDKIDSITKGFLDRQSKVNSKFYDRKAQCWRHGVLILNNKDYLRNIGQEKSKIFAEYSYDQLK